jgi:hypothetical protein
MVCKNTTTGATIVSITYGVEGWEGTLHNVSVDPVDGVMRCTCREGWRGDSCQHQEKVLNGEAGKPVIRGHQRPSRPTVRRVTVSPEMRDRLSEYDV